jgi:hypothetical protein
VNPWKIIGWIVLALMLCSLTFCGLVCVNIGNRQVGAAVADIPGRPAQLYLKSISCDPNHGRPRADLTFENTGGGEIRYPKAYVSFGGKIHDSYIHPNILLRSSLGTATVYANEGDAASCRLDRVQDNDGVRIQVLNSAG